MLPGQRGGHHGHLDGAAVLPLALRGVTLPDPGRGDEHGFRQGQGVTGGKRNTIVLNACWFLSTIYSGRMTKPSTDMTGSMMAAMVLTPMRMITL